MQLLTRHMSVSKMTKSQALMSWSACTTAKKVMFSLWSVWCAYYYYYYNRFMTLYLELPG